MILVEELEFGGISMLESNDLHSGMLILGEPFLVFYLS